MGTDGTPLRAIYRYLEGVDRFIGTAPEEGSSGTSAAYDVGSSGARVPLLSGLGANPNIWSGVNVFTQPLVTQAHYKVGAVQVVGAQGAAVADAADGVNAAAAPTQAEFNALVAVFNANVALFNDLLAEIRTHGLIAT